MPPGGRPLKWKVEDLPARVKASCSWTDLCAKLGVTGSSIQRLKRWAKQLGLDTSHFVHYTPRPEFLLSDEEIFCPNSEHTYRGKDRFYERTPDQCMLCPQGPVWNGEPLKFQIDHKNGDNRDCRWENLQKLCPNCHTQTETFCGRNKKRIAAGTATGS